MKWNIFEQKVMSNKCILENFMYKTTYGDECYDSNGIFYIGVNGYQFGNEWFQMFPTLASR